MSERTDAWSRPSGATICKWWVKPLGGASADAQSYWQGRFAACAFVDFPFVMVTRGTVGALPQTLPEALSLDPARGRRKGTKSPLDPFARLRWSHSLNSSACGFFILPPPMLLMFAASPANPHSPSQSAHSDRAASSLPPPAIHTASAPRRRAGQCWSRSFHPADDRR